MLCTQCGTENAETAAVCAQCGAVLHSKEASLPTAKGSFRFFKNCGQSLRRFSVVLFVINLFLTAIAAVIASVVLYLNYGSQGLLVLIGPLITAIVILVLLARFLSALVYGFAEIVENNERQSKNS